MWLFQVYFIPDTWRLIIPQSIQDFRPPFVIENICVECPRGPQKCCLVPYRIPNFIAGSAFTDPYTRDNITRILKNAESFDFVPRRMIAWKVGKTCPAYNFETGNCTSYKVRSVRCSVYYFKTDTISPQWR